MALTLLVLGLLATVAPHTTVATGVSYPIPPSSPCDAGKLDSTPVGMSFEFFMWPSYMTNISIATSCLEHFDKLYGKKTPTRIGGTTQDRAEFDPDFDGYVSYHVEDPLEAPMVLKYGPKFFDLILAKNKTRGFLHAIELGNEPDLYYKYWNKPVATAPWNMSQEGANAAQWAQAFIDGWDEPEPMLSSGSYAVPVPLEPNWPNTVHLVTEAFNETVKAGVKEYCAHLYALSDAKDLKTEMNHVRTVSDVSHFIDDIATVRSVGRDLILGETGFHGLDEEIDATLGGAIQILDKTLRATAIAFFNWWSDDQVEAPFYGGYMAALALNGGHSIIASDDGNDAYAQYVIFRDGAPHKVLLINTDYYSGEGERNITTFNLTGVTAAEVKALRMTASTSEYTTNLKNSDGEQGLTIGNCSILGQQSFETGVTTGGNVTFTLAASEALLIYL
nr:glycoside hydrolase family 79 protein [Colletotrichum truncatum]KAF6781639.1 glycoside hydrolase family 79 protein [Colletotrichum truncatum]